MRVLFIKCASKHYCLINLLSDLLALGKEGKKAGFTVPGSTPGLFLCNCVSYSNGQSTIDIIVQFYIENQGPAAHPSSL